MSKLKQDRIQDLIFYAISIFLFAAVWIATEKIPHMADWTKMLLFLIPFIFVAVKVLMGAIVGIVEHRRITADLPVFAAAVALFALDDCKVAIAVLLINLLARSFEHRRVELNRAAIKKTMAKLDDNDLTQAMNAALKSKTKQESFMRRYVRFICPVVIVSALCLGIIPPLFDYNWEQWLKRAAALLCLSYPSAILISVPLCAFCGINLSARNGIFMKSALTVNKLARTSTVVMDKNGTVTDGNYRVIGLEPVGISQNDLLTLAAAAEIRSDHPIAKALREACDELPSERLITNVREFPGRGLEANVCGRKVLVGNSALMEANSIKAKTAFSDATVLHVAADGIYAGYILIDDRIKGEAKRALGELYAMGVEKTVMLTGDDADAGKAAATALGVNSVYAQLLPSDKVIAIDELQREKHAGTLMFIGNGNRDNHIFEKADIGVTLGEKALWADVYVRSDDMLDVSLAVDIAQQTVRRQLGCMIFAFTAKLALLLLAGFGVIDTLLAVILDSLVIIISIFNAERASRI